MRSGTSFFDFTVFKKTICRFWPLWASYFAIWLVTLPLNGLMMLRFHLSGFGRDIEAFAMDRVPNAAAETSLTLAVIFGVLAAMAVFSYLYNARSANLFGSLPVKREGMFLTHYLAGLAFLIVPNAVIFLLCLLVEAAGSCVCMQALLFWLAVSCGECLLFYSMAVFCAMFTGHILALPAFYAVLNGIAAGAVSLVQLVFHIFYYGYYGYELPRIVLWLTPVVQLGESVSGHSYYKQDVVTDSVLSSQRVLVTRGLDAVGIYAVAAVVLAVAAFFLYRARHMESAGDVVSVKPMRPVFKYGVALCVGPTLGIGTIWFTGGGEIAFVVATVIWGVIGYFAAEMLLQKSFKVFKRWKGSVAVAAVFAALFLVVSLDLTGFETRIPDPASVDSVNVYTANVVYLGDDGDNIYMNVTDPEVIGLLNILHREAVAQRDEEWQTQAQVGGTSTGLNLSYTLRGGGTLNRRYTVWLNPKEINTEGTAAWAVQQLYDNHELYWQVYGFDELESIIAQGGRLESATCGGYDEEYGYRERSIFYGYDASALLAAVREDFFAGRIAVRRVDDEERWYGGRSENSLTFEAVGQEDSEGHRSGWSVSIAVQDTATSTLAALEEMADRAVRPGTEGYWE